MNVNEYMKANRDGDWGWLVRGMVCADGFEMSVQASSGHYCEPREDHAENYTHVEVGFPSQGEPLLREYHEGIGSSVYAYVPVEVVESIIAKHGGVKGD